GEPQGHDGGTHPIPFPLVAIHGTHRPIPDVGRDLFRRPPRGQLAGCRELVWSGSLPDGLTKFIPPTYSDRAIPPRQAKTVADPPLFTAASPFVHRICSSATAGDSPRDGGRITTSTPRTTWGVSGGMPRRAPPTSR